MEILALLFALLPIIVTIVFWVYKMGVRPSEKNAELTPLVREVPVASVVQVAPVAAANVATHASNEDEIAVVLAAAASRYINNLNNKI